MLLMFFLAVLLSYGVGFEFRLRPRSCSQNSFLCLFEHILVTLVVVTSAAAVSHVACQFCPVWRCHDSLCWKSEVLVHIYVLLYKKWYGLMYTRRGSAPPIKIRGSTADCNFEYLASQHINQPIKSWNHAKRFFCQVSVRLAVIRMYVTATTFLHKANDDCLTKLSENHIMLWIVFIMAHDDWKSHC